MNKDPSYLFAITPFEGKSFVTWADNYNFDPEKEEISLYDRHGGKVAMYEFLNEIKRIDIYDVSRRYEDQKPVQTILGRKVS